MASPASSPRRQQQSPLLSCFALRARDALVLEHLPLADALVSAAARRLFPPLEREDLIQAAREALVRSAPRCRAGEPGGPHLRRCIAGAQQHHLRDRVRLVRISRREHEKDTWPLGHTSLDASAAGELFLLEQLAAPAVELTLEASLTGPALEQLVDQLPAAQVAQPGSRHVLPLRHADRRGKPPARPGTRPAGGVPMNRPIPAGDYVEHFDPELPHHRAWLLAVLEQLVAHEPQALEEGGTLRRLWFALQEAGSAAPQPSAAAPPARPASRGNPLSVPWFAQLD